MGVIIQYLLHFFFCPLCPRCFNPTGFQVSTVLSWKVWRKIIWWQKLILQIIVHAVDSIIKITISIRFSYSYWGDYIPYCTCFCHVLTLDFDCSIRQQTIFCFLLLSRVDIFFFSRLLCFLPVVSHLTFFWILCLLCSWNPGLSARLIWFFFTKERGPGGACFARMGRLLRVTRWMRGEETGMADRSVKGSHWRVVVFGFMTIGHLDWIADCSVLSENWQTVAKGTPILSAEIKDNF